MPSSTGFSNATATAFQIDWRQSRCQHVWAWHPHEPLGNQWARSATSNQANYVTTAMEDTRALRALHSLTRAGNVNADHTLVLRTASNFDQPSPGISAAESLASEKVGGYSAHLPELAAAHEVGSRVVHASVEGWTTYETTPPPSP